VAAEVIQTAKLNGLDPRAWLADVLTRIANMPQPRLHALLPRNRKKSSRTRRPVRRDGQKDAGLARWLLCD
jgi:transposase